MSAVDSVEGPLVEFFQLVPNANEPRRADKSVGGVIPARALRYCEALTTASAFGWYIFLPLSFKIVWDGHDMLWTYEGADEWLPLTRDAVHPAGGLADLDRLHRQNGAGLESAGARRGQSFPRLGLPYAGRDDRNRHLVRAAVRQYPRGQNRYADRIPQGRPVPAGAAGAQGSLLRQIYAELRGQGPDAIVCRQLGRRQAN